MSEVRASPPEADRPADQCDLLCLDLPHAEHIRAGLPPLETVESGARLGRALADPTRLAIAAALLDGDELCVCDIAWVVGHAQNLASHHLRQLRAADLVTSRRDRKLVMYRLTTTGRSLVSALLGRPPTEPTPTGPTPTGPTPTGTLGRA